MLNIRRYVALVVARSNPAMELPASIASELPFRSAGWPQQAQRSRNESGWERHTCSTMGGNALSLDLNLFPRRAIGAIKGGGGVR
jgi:hypothetical protein